MEGWEGELLEGLGTTLVAMPTTVISCEGLTVERHIFQAADFQGVQGLMGRKGRYAGEGTRQASGTGEALGAMAFGSSYSESQGQLRSIS